MNILLLEDDVRLCETITYLLEKQDIHAFYRHSIKDGLMALNSNSYDLIILDRMLQDGDGLTFVKQLRSQSNYTPILILSALGEIDEKVQGIECGADDYLAKPFEFRELLARIKMIIRRCSNTSNLEILQYADISYDVKKHTISCNGNSTVLSKKEAQLFHLLISNPEQLVSRDILINHIWGAFLAIESGNLDNQVYFVRKQLSLINSKVKIKVVRGVGYYLTYE